MSDKTIGKLRDDVLGEKATSAIIEGKCKLEYLPLALKALQEAGLGPIHSLEYSLGTWGKTERLPGYAVLKLLTMCGHAMIAADLVGKMLRDVKRGRRTVKSCVVEMAQCCTCGNFNLTRGEKIFEEVLSTQMVNSLY